MKMRLWWLTGTAVLLVGSVIWWQMQSPLASGVYPVDGGGSQVLFAYEEDHSAAFSLPVTWVKSHPFEQVPVLNSALLFDENENLIASIEGETEIEVDDEGSWYERHARGFVPFRLNEQINAVEDGGRVSMPLNDDLSVKYETGELRWSLKETHSRFDLRDTYKMFIVFDEEGAEAGDWEMSGHIPFGGSADGPSDGYVFSLKGESGHVLEEVMMWLPGMEEDYMEKRVLAEWGDLSRYYGYGDGRPSFEGEQLNLPLELTGKELLLYFPVTEAIRDAIGDGRYHLMPVYKVLDEEGRTYYTGFGGGGGPEGAEQVILPEKEEE
ncbi:hypothetical protein CR205_02615 [Alteribacter lacisalsi]|uniref:Uncharacterized protein n=1 Tax=Alteribacter lacisalsi TaxID=2045244 RepID=A0A2W0H8L4_9BACI|nr:hypothetical protein [Alteribacter lacisalsi]PYZ97507.1 hypothetical protein CR205_02615 [Alteribacter lacisalsi]